MTKRREIVENGDDNQRKEYAEIRKTIKKKARKDIRKYNQEIVRETITASKSLKNVSNNIESMPRQTDHTPRKAG